MRNLRRCSGAGIALSFCALVGMAGCRNGDDGTAQAAAARPASASSAPSTSADGADPRIAEEATIRALDADLMKAITANDVAKITSYFADSATVMVPGQPAAEGSDRIAREFTGLMSLPGFAYSFTPDTVMVARSGEMAYEHGDYAMTLNDRNGKPETTNARYVTVWTKVADGSWKILIDAPTTTR